MVDFQTTFADRKVLITGGLGFIGSNLARRLLESKAHVTVVDSLIPEYGGNLFNISGIEDRVTVNVADVRDAHSMDYLVQGQDYLFNLAGQTSHMDSMENPYVDLEINCKAQLSILESCRKRNPNIKIVFASTRQVYGKPEHLPVDENHLLRPVDEVWGGAQLRDFTYVDDAVEAFLLAAASEAANGKAFNLGGDQAIDLKGLAKLLVEINNGGEYVERSFPADRKLIDIGDYYGDFSRIRSSLGWEPQVPLREGLSRILAFYREHLNSYL